MGSRQQGKSADKHAATHAIPAWRDAMTGGECETRASAACGGCADEHRGRDAVEEAG